MSSRYDQVRSMLHKGQVSFDLDAQCEVMCVPKAGSACHSHSNLSCIFDVLLTPQADPSIWEPCEKHSCANVIWIKAEDYPLHKLLG